MDTTVYVRESAIDKFVTGITLLLGLGMIVGPLWWLHFLSMEQPDPLARLQVITGFSVVFTALLSILTVAKPFEILAATALYGAVLMVSMQLGFGGKGGTNV